MKTPFSAIREALAFNSPPRIRVLTDHEHMSDAVELAEALEECGAEAEVRFEEDASDYDHVHPDAYVVDHMHAPIPPKTKGSLVVAISDDRNRKTAGFDLHVRRSVEPRELIRKIGEHLKGGMAIA